jgi:hypothetical protein
MDQQLRIANDTDMSFGGAHLILAGDMRQLKAVKAVAMFQKLPTNNTNPKTTDFHARFQLGRTRYMEITDYIELTFFRQQESMMLGNCLGRCRTNTETPADIN